MFFEIFDLNTPLTLAVFLKSVGLVFLGTLANYFMLTVPAYYYCKKNSGINAVRLQEGSPFPGQVAHEIKWSMLSIAIYSFLTVCLIVGWRAGAFPQFYLDPSALGWDYFLFSIILVILIQDVYFYFAHRLLHTRKLIRYHGVHHRSKVPTPFVMYAFHPVEALVHFVRLPLIMWVFPTCPLMLLITEGFISNVINVYSHLNHEPNFLRRIQSFHGWTSATSTFHDLHHCKIRGNYGFYLKFWDRLFNTMLPETDERIAQVHSEWQKSAEWQKSGKP